MFNDAAPTTEPNPVSTSLRVILAQDPPSSDHDASQAYIALVDNIRFSKDSGDESPLLFQLQAQVPELVMSIQRDTLYAMEHLQWLKREDVPEMDLESPEVAELTFGAALRCHHALHLSDMLCRFYNELLAPHST